VLVALVASGFGLVLLTAQKTSLVMPHPAKTVDDGGSEWPYRLSLSSEAAEISIISGDSLPSHTPDGKLSHRPEDRLISLRIRWKTPPSTGETRFAKLTLDPSGKPTITHVFDSTGDIDDILELP